MNQKGWKKVRDTNAKKDLSGCKSEVARVVQLDSTLDL